MVRLLRNSSNISVVLDSMRGNMSSASRPSELQSDRGVLYPTQSGVELELPMLHVMVYPTLPPVQVASINVNTLLYTALNRPSRLLDSRFQFLKKTLTDDGVSPSSLGVARVFPTHKSTEAPRHYEDCLRSLKISYWTGAPISDVLAAKAILLYLENEHPILGFFDADPFLSDLVNCRPDFCSRFLVTSLLYLACVGSLDISLSFIGFSNHG